MNSRDCLSEQQLTLSYYGELDNDRGAASHLAGCAACRSRLARLRRDLERLPALNVADDPHWATRLAARLAERRSTRPAWRLPAVASLLAGLMLVVAVNAWLPVDSGVPVPSERLQMASSSQAPQPDFELLEDLELLEHLELLRQIEGV
ncbi:MAG: hypothetical protein RQ723_06965 [Desulfuromonadales bacterium]|nr:hypothetical protein [Desulfuromonadales bacterium]